MTSRRATARDLLAAGAVELRPDAPFTWASGLRSPIYCDNRLTLSDPDLRRRLTDGFASLVESHDLRPEVIAGTATAGIPHAAWLADRLSLPLVYVRSAAKSHGRGNRVEGRLPEGTSVVLVEDTVSTGGSALAAVEAIREAGARVIAVLAIFDYGFLRARDAFAGAGVTLHALAGYDDLVAEARAAGAVSDDDLATLAAWRTDPEGWGR
jgi:orotate phosphoribosyltransferase